MVANSFIDKTWWELRQREMIHSFKPIFQQHIKTNHILGRMYSFFNSIQHFFSFLGLSPVRVKSKSAIEVTKSTTLHCDYFLDNAGEELYSVLWYWTPKSSTYTSVDLRLLDKSGLSLPPQLPQGPVQFFRYRKDDQNGKRAWEDRLRGIFNVNVSTRTWRLFYACWGLLT